MLIKVISVFLLCIFVATQSALADEVLMAFGEKIPPFCFPETHSGIELEVIGEALAHKGHILKPVYVPLARVPTSFMNKSVNAAMTDMGKDLTPHGGYYGDPAVIYENVFITLKDRNLVIKKPEDLQGLSIISFQGALKRYPKWLAMPQKAGKYRGQSNQELQVKTLFKGRFDVVLSDRNIFRYFMLKRKRNTGIVFQEIQEHKFTTLNPLDYRPVFRSEQIKDDFNMGLKALKESGRFQEIYDKYLKE